MTPHNTTANNDTGTTKNNDIGTAINNDTGTAQNKKKNEIKILFSNYRAAYTLV